jgi:hypothetical protein
MDQPLSWSHDSKYCHAAQSDLTAEDVVTYDAVQDANGVPERYGNT